MAVGIGSLLVKAFFGTLINAAIAIGVSKLTKAMAKKPVKVLQKVDVEYAGGLEPRRKLYGYFRAAGLHVIPAVTTGLTGTRLHKCLAISEGPIESVDAVFFNNDRIEAADFSGGPITSGTYEGHAQIFPHLGDASQPVESAMLAIPGWTTEHRGDGVAYVYVFYDANNEVYTQGAPDLVVEGQGCLVYDPRLDVSPGANPDNLTYWAFSTCPPLIAADFLRWGCDELAENILWSDVVTAANASDEDVDIPDSATQKRFTCSVEVYAPQSLAERDSTIDMLARSFMGRIWYSGGKWHMRAGVYTSPVDPIVDDDFLSSVKIGTAQPRSAGGVFNTVRGSYVDQGENTQPKPTPEVSSPTYVSEDGETIYTDAAWPTARTSYEAQRNDILLLRQSRRRISIESLFRFKASNYQLYDIVPVTCAKVGWTAQDARIVEMKILQNFTVWMRLEEIESSDFTDPDPADYLTPDAISIPDSTPFTPGAPRNLSATSTANGIIFTWDPPVNAPPGVLYRLYEYPSSTPFGSASQVGPDTPQTSLVVPKTDTTLRYYWVTSVDPITLNESTQAPPSNGVPGAAATASSALAAIVYPGTAEATVYTSNADTNSVSVTPSGGTAPYTYSWTFTAGGTNITIDASTSATTTFSETTGLSEGETRSGTARCRVTDNVAATYDVYVAVTMTRLYAITLADETINATGAVGGPGGPGSAAVASYVVSSDGYIYPSPGPGTSYQWKNPSASASDYDVRFTLNSGTLNSGTAGSWLQLSSARQVTGARSPGSGSGTSTLNVTVEIRLHNSPFTVLATKTLIMNETIP